MTIEESGENWTYYTDVEPPATIQVIQTCESVERTTTIERPAKRRKPKKPEPFGFARVLEPKPKPKRKGKR